MLEHHSLDIIFQKYKQKTTISNFMTETILMSQLKTASKHMRTLEKLLLVKDLITQLVVY